MEKYGCIGKKLTHSFSKEIHAKLADYKYELIELTETEVDSFFKNKEFNAVNVTIPYKETVIPYLDFLSDVAKRIGAVNTVVNKNGKLYGYNTDYYGMKALIEKTGIEIKNKKVMILGTGGTSKTARVLTKDLGASEIVVVSRQKKESFITYEEAVSEHRDANVIINTTPSGMYPDCDSKPIDISAFKDLEGVIDAVYNPLCTNLILNAKKKGIKAESGLFMLVMQAVVAAEKFMDREIPKEAADSVFASVLASKENIVLTGMPGSGKSTVGKLLGIDGFTFIDTDEEIEKRCGTSIKDLISEKGEKHFRDLESEVIKDVSSKGSQIISTGGGAILREENVHALKRNGKLFFIDAKPERLCPTDSRPLSDTAEKLKKVYSERIDIYRETADVVVPDMATAKEEAEFILRKRMELMK
ncbi:MAG: shikimate dehydrogenase [Clostridia bacterium]|nr:shikimate dehydrogenase [Clostridia bacterium]